MSDKSVAQKARVKPGTRIAVLNGVSGVVESLGLPEDITFVDPGDAQLVFLFVRYARRARNLDCRRPSPSSRRAPRSGSSTARARRPRGST